jgi:hypothetical protein
MASLKAIFFNKSDESSSKRMLRAKSVECISSIAVAVGKEKFMNDATKVRIHIILVVVLMFYNSDVKCKQSKSRHTLVKGIHSIIACLSYVSV